jgi:hypothetical protein
MCIYGAEVAQALCLGFTQIAWLSCLEPRWSEPNRAG